MMADGASSTSTERAPPTSSHAPALQRGRSHEEMEIARHLIEHSQSLPASAAAATASSQAPAVHASAPAHGDVVMGGAEESGSDPSATSDHHARDDNSARAYSPPYPTGTPVVRTGSPSQRRGGSAVAAPGGQACSNCGTTKTPLWRRSPAGEIICNACGLYYKARNQMRPVGMKRGTSAMNPPADGQTHDRATSDTSIQSQATYVSADPNVNGTCPGGGRCNGTGGHEGCNGCPAYNNRISKTAQVALQQTDPNVQHDPNAPRGGAHAGSRNVATSVVVACQNCGTTITPLWRRDEAGNTICNACGLYHKLHGSHRPVQMKKAEIKRRKRVVPANNPAYPDTGSPRSTDAMDADSPFTTTESRASIAPSIRSSVPPTRDDDHPHLARVPGGPIPVDFTGAFRPRVAIIPRPPSPVTHDSDPENQTRSIPRKRTISASCDDDKAEHSRTYPRSPQRSREQQHRHSLDPSLSTTTPAAETRELAKPPSTTANSNAKEARRAELQREAERMREMLLLKERELAELGDEG